MHRRALMVASIIVGFALGFVFPSVYLLPWGVGFAMAFVLMWPELKAGYSRRAERTVGRGRDNGKPVKPP
ncbi:MAG: hypothetical protein EXR67_00160 [Dehalococcoidia bacterium]|nr:hypothetical protein [Dehalococcoidia bacterium]